MKLKLIKLLTGLYLETLIKLIRYKGNFKPHSRYLNGIDVGGILIVSETSNKVAMKMTDSTYILQPNISISICEYLIKHKRYYD